MGAQQQQPTYAHIPQGYYLPHAGDGLQQQQQQHQQEEEQEAVYWAGISGSISTEQQTLTFWRRVMPSAEALSCDQY